MSLTDKQQAVRAAALSPVQQVENERRWAREERAYAARQAHLAACTTGSTAELRRRTVELH
jgi:hypothetical protein